MVGEACKIGANGGQATKSSSAVEGDGRHEGQAYSWLFRSGMAEIVWKTAREFAPEIRLAITIIIKRERSRSIEQH